MKRDATQTIWRTVVFAGAMLGAPACSKKPAQTTPTNNTTTAPATTDPAMAPTDTATTPAPAADPCAGDPCAGDPCAGPRPHAGDEGGGMGRGFVLS